MGSGVWIFPNIVKDYVSEKWASLDCLYSVTEKNKGSDVCELIRTIAGLHRQTLWRLQLSPNECNKREDEELELRGVSISLASAGA